MTQPTPSSSGHDDARLRAEDAHARELARSELTRPVVLEAGAGTGKTAVLVARVISWCVGGGWERAAQALARPGAEAAAGDDEAVAARVLERTVAITFTERAAAEMEQRVTAGFAALARGGAPLGLAREALVAAAGGEGALAHRAAALLAASDSLAVSTFHGLCRRLLARFPLASGVHPAFEVDADGRRSVALIDELLQTRAREAYGEPGDPRWTELAALGLGARQLATALRALVASGAPAAALRGADPYAAPRVAAYCAQLLPPLRALLAAFAAQPIPPKAKGRVKLAQSLADACARLAASADATTPTIEGLLAGARPLLLENVRKRVGEWARGVFGQNESLWLAERSAEASAACASLGPLLAQLERCDSSRLRLLNELLAELLGELLERLREQGVVGFAELLRRARTLLTTNPAVLEELREGIDQLLVDEFQDTDPLQVEIVEALALSGPVARRPGLLVVGDAKQSIYGWRNADLAAYEDFVTRVLAQQGLHCRLSLNFRSREPILAEVERAIEPVMRAERGLQPRFERLVCGNAAPPEEPRADAASSPQSATDPAVEYWVSWEAEDAPAGEGGGPSASRACELEAQLLVRDLLAQAARGTAPSWGSSAVLLRTTTAQETYLQALRDAGIPYVVERDRSYYRRREVIDATTLLRVVADANDQVATLAWLRSPTVGVPDAALLLLWQHGLPALLAALTGPSAAQLASIDEAISAAARALPTGMPELEGVAEHWAPVLRVAVRALAELRGALQRQPADRFVEGLRLLLGAEALEAARFLGEQRLANLDRFFRELEAQLVASEGGLQGLLRSLRADVADRREAAEAPASEGGQGAVRVMTIHKAKGLTFDTVYLLGLHTRPGAAGSEPKDACEAVGGPWQWEWRFAGIETLGFAGIRQQRLRVAAAEAVRTLYVGMTRPRHRLVLAGAWPRPGATPRGRESHLDLLQQRRLAPPDLGALQRRAAAAGPEHAVCRDAAGVRWRLADAGPAVPSPSSRPCDAVPQTPLDALAAELAAGAALQGAALARMAHPFAAAASALPAVPAEGTPEADVAVRPSAADAPPASRSRAIGTVVHRALEELELGGDLSRALAEQRARLPRYGAQLGEGEEVDAIVAGAARLLDQLAASPLLERLREIAAHVLGREVPLLLQGGPPPAAAWAYVSGSIDLLYRDPRSDELVIVDYKTDRVVDDAALAARVAEHLPQGRLYQRALQQALGLEGVPRFELWFLGAGRIVAVG